MQFKQTNKEQTKKQKTAPPTLPHPPLHAQGKNWGGPALLAQILKQIES